MIYNETNYNSHWNTRKLASLGDFSRGRSKHRPRNDKKLFEGGGYPLIQTSEVRNSNLYITSHGAEYNEFGLLQSKLWKEGTLCITIAANIAETGILAYPMCFPDSVVGFNAFENETSELFMHYVFTYIKHSIQKSVVGSIQDNINLDYLQNLDFKIPSKEYQDKIVRVLNSFDKKIEINKKSMIVLENMAKEIYTHWFVQFDFPDEDGRPYATTGKPMEWCKALNRKIPVGWTLESMTTCCDIIDCLHSKKPLYKFENEKFYLLQLENLVDLGLIDISEKYFVSEQDYKKWTSKIEVSEGDILVTNAGRVGGIYRIPKGVLSGIGRNMTSIRPKSVPATYLYYFFMGDDMKMQIQSNTDNGAFFDSLNVRGIKELQLLLPPEGSDLIEQFVSICTPMRERIESLARENKELIEQRDWLLMMLMNGQITVH